MDRVTVLMEFASANPPSVESCVKYMIARVQTENHAVEMVFVPRKEPVIAILDGLILRVQPESALPGRTKTA